MHINRNTRDALRTAIDYRRLAVVLAGLALGVLLGRALAAITLGAMP